jgi:hypothetical protein
MIMYLAREVALGEQLLWSDGKLPLVGGIYQWWTSSASSAGENIVIAGVGILTETL